MVRVYLKSTLSRLFNGLIPGFLGPPPVGIPPSLPINGQENETSTSSQQDTSENGVESSIANSILPYSSHCRQPT